MLPQDDKPDNNDEALCPSLPKCGSIVIVLSADDPSTFGSALKKLESELATLLCVLSVNAPSKLTTLSSTLISSIEFISPSDNTKATYKNSLSVPDVSINTLVPPTSLSP